MANKLSVVIPVLNEGEELSRTLFEVRRTASDNVDVIVVDDASTDGYDYKQASLHYNACYIRHPERWGSGPTKQHGIDEVCTPYFLVIDSHMRFYDSIWWQEICDQIDNNHEAVYCTRCKPWSARTGREMETPIHGGAYVDFFATGSRSLLDLHWLRAQYPNEKILTVPCVLGACYAASKDYWRYLRGFEGLRGYGCEEIYISLKSWMMGKGCRLINNITIGHLFREEFPYVVGRNEDLINKMIVTDLLLPDEYKIRILECIKLLSYTAYNKYMQTPVDSNLKKEISQKITPDCFIQFLSINNLARSVEEKLKMER